MLGQKSGGAGVAYWKSLHRTQTVCNGEMVSYLSIDERSLVLSDRVALVWW
jgi:hypothetical protein